MKLAIMANFYNLTVISAVLLLYTLGVDCIDSSHIVQLHNDVRQLVREGRVPGQPRGKNLVDMEWDDQLALKAQHHAEECIFAHDQPKDERWGHVGQSIYVSGNSNPVRNENWDDAVEDWYNEYKIYSFSDQFSPYASHYTQLVWHSTKYVGCGFAYCPERPDFQNYFVCNYGPGGNMPDEYPYERA